MSALVSGPSQSGLNNVIAASEEPAAIIKTPTQATARTNVHTAATLPRAAGWKAAREAPTLLESAPTPRCVATEKNLARNLHPSGEKPAQQ